MTDSNLPTLSAPTQNTEAFSQLLANLAAHLPTEPAMPSLALKNGGGRGASAAVIGTGAKKAAVQASPRSTNKKA